MFAFDRPGLEMFVEDVFSKKLENLINVNAPFDHLCHSLIGWAEREGKVDALLQAFQMHANPVLRTLAGDLLAVSPRTPGSDQVLSPSGARHPPGPLVAVCYSEADEEAMKEVKTFLRPLEREGLLRLWTSRDVSIGSVDFDESERSLAEARHAVLLISQSFLGSDFAARLPELFTRQAAGGLTLLPVFLSPSGAEDQVFPYRDPKGQGRQRRLTDFRGVATHDRPLTSLKKNDRELALVQLSKRLRELAKT